MLREEPMKKKATKSAKRDHKKAAVEDLAPKVDPKGGTVQPQEFVIVKVIDKTTPVLFR